MSPPSAFGTYRVLHQIGSGVLGPVFRAYDSELDRLVAIKTFRLDLVPERAAALADRLRASAGTPAPHRAVVGVVEAGLEGATPFIALEFAAGDSLDVLLRQSGAWPAERALMVAGELAAAIDASWDASFGHGALHPRDIFIDPGSHEPRATGFGIGQALEEAGVKAPARRPYSAPERAEGASWDRRADVYSLGVITFEMLSGHRPVGPDDEGESVAAELPPASRAAVRRVLAVAMADRPDDRYETAAAFFAALSEAALPAAGGEVEPGLAEVPGPSTGADSDPPRPAEPRMDPSSVAGRARRTRPLALELPLLEGMDAEADPAGGGVDAPEGRSEPAPAFVSAIPAPESVVMADTDAVPDVNPEAEAAGQPHAEPDLWREGDRAPEPRPRFSDVPVDAVAPLERAPRIDFAPPVPDGSGAEATGLTARFPWAAVASVFVAGIVLGGVVMYQYGWKRGAEAARPSGVAVVPTPEPAAVAPPAAQPPPAALAAVDEAAATPAPPRVPPTPAGGRLVIQSVPTGALVMIDGRRAGGTPVTVSVPFGRHEIQVARPGYVPHTERVEITKQSASRTLRVQLKRGAGGGAPRR